MSRTTTERQSMAPSGGDLLPLPLTGPGRVVRMLRATVGALAVAILATAPAFAAARWTVKWVFRMDGSVGSSPAVEVDGTVYVRSMDGNIYALLGSSGCGLQRGSPWPMFHGNAQHTGHAVPMLADGK